MVCPFQKSVIHPSRPIPNWPLTCSKRKLLSNLGLTCLLTTKQEVIPRQPIGVRLRLVDDHEFLFFFLRWYASAGGFNGDSPCSGRGQLHQWRTWQKEAVRNDSGVTRGQRSRWRALRGQIYIVITEPSRQLIHCPFEYFGTYFFFFLCRFLSKSQTWRPIMSGCGLDRSFSTGSLWCRRCSKSISKERMQNYLQWVLNGNHANMHVCCTYGSFSALRIGIHSLKTQRLRFTLAAWRSGCRA